MSECLQQGLDLDSRLSRLVPPATCMQRNPVSRNFGLQMQEGHTTLAGQSAKAPTTIPQTGHHVEFDLMVVGKQLLAGGIAGAVAKSSTAPLERVKILFQVANKEYPYTGVFSTLGRIHKNEGIRGLWKGNVPAIARVFPYAAVQFATFDVFKRLFTPANVSVSPWANFFAGAAAGSTAVLCTYPLDVARARIAVQVKHHQYTGFLHALTTMYRKEGGIRALWRGIGPTMVGIIPYAGINFFTYDTLKWYYTNKWREGESKETSIPTMYRLVFGAIAGLLGQSVTYPLDVVRRRMQIDGLSLETVYSYSYRSTLHGLKEIIQKEGFLTLFKGLQINFIKVVPLVSMAFIVNDLLKKWLGLKDTEGGIERKHVSTG